MTAHTPQPEGLEPVTACPACGQTGRGELYRDLDDAVFASPGRWTLYRCSACRSAYLDPRPTGAALAAAYSTYYTHESPTVAPAPRRLSALRLGLKHGYLNAALSYRLQPATRLARLWLAPFPLRRRAVRLAIRDLPFPDRREPRLLDVGCGNGVFMLEAQALGWLPEGIDPDEEAVRSAREGGLTVQHTTLEEATFPPGRFDAITLHHVIEHLPDPQGALEICRRLLRPSGRLWMATPNLDAAGHRIFRRDWRGLDPPRHVVLFTPRSLRGLLQSVGFEVSFLPPARSWWMFETSESLRRSRTGKRSRTPLLRLRSLLLDLWCLRNRTKGEELVILARPSGAA